MYFFATLDESELCETVEKTVTTLESMEKNRGHLYNWYDIKSLKVLGQRYVSTVDSGNLTACLSIVERGLVKIDSVRSKALASRIRKIIEETDFGFLYDEKKHLFYLGFDESKGEKDRICYDLMMSEARTTFYYAISKGIVPYKHWKALGRTVLSSNGYIGMASWAGTAFEFFMPQLFLPCYKNSFIYESLNYAYDQQKRNAKNRIWGISESAFFGFDSMLNYQYKAHGIPSLALKRYEESEFVISPYSAYLSLCMKKRSAFTNIENMHRTALHGKYGLYESIDFSPKRGVGNGTVVRSYMAHHVGMSISACANACFDGVLTELFMSDESLYAARELLQEKIPVDAVVFKGNGWETEKEIRRIRQQGIKSSESDICEPCAALISENGMTVVCSSNGHVMLKCDDIMINRTEFDKFDLSHSLKVSFFSDGKEYASVPLMNKREAQAYSFEYSSSRVTYITSGSDFSGTVKYSFSDDGNCFVISTRCSNDKDASVVLSFEPVMDTERAFASHRAFSSLFILCEYDAKTGIAVYQRNLRDEEREKYYLAVSGTDIKELSLNDENGVKLSGRNEDIKKRPALTPACTLVTGAKRGGTNIFCLCFSKDRQHAVRSVINALKQRKQRMKDSCTLCAQTREDILTKILFDENRSYPGNERLSVFTLWKWGISGDLPIICLDIIDENTKKVSDILNVFKSFSVAGVRFEIVIFVSEEDGYLKSISKRIKNIVERCGCREFIGMKGGIFIFDKAQCPDLFETLQQVSSAVISVYDYDIPEKVTAGADERIDAVEEISVPEEEFIPSSAYRSYGGSFYDGGFIVDKRKKDHLPFSYILTGRAVGSVVTHDFIAFTFFLNSQLNRLTPFFGTLNEKKRSERILCRTGGKYYDLCAVSYSVYYKDGTAIYSGIIDGTCFTLEMFACEKYPLKLIKFTFLKDCSVIYEIRTCGSTVMMCDEGGRSYVKYYDYRNSEYPGSTSFAGAFLPNRKGRSVPSVQSGTVRIETEHGFQDGYTVFYLGASLNENGIPAMIRCIDNDFYEKERKLSSAFARSVVPPLSLKMKSENASRFLPFCAYQAAASRFYARTGYYQSSGAYGFRDQLQDCLCLVYSRPGDVRTHLIRCAAHQYAEGDVQHWWHPSSGNHASKGLRSKCSDDFLFLPFVTADYIRITGDESVLFVNVRYLTSPVLKENERYEQPEISDRKETLLKHCLRALSYGERFGKHGLLLMGSCDWNDGFSAVGTEGKGESAFSTLFYMYTIREFMFILKKYEPEAMKHYEKIDSALESSFEKNCFANDRYRRAFYDDGTPMGREGENGCEIDLLPQSFAVFAGCKNIERILKSLDTVYNKLFDSKYKLIRLFDPHFGDGTRYAGYINAYPGGIRENGGQYSHAAVWAAKAMLEAGKREEGLEFISALNPVTRCSDPFLSEKYRAEPYFISADIYYTDGVYGRGGWSLYTGSAAWYYKVFVENVLGIVLSDGYKKIAVYPNAEYTAVIKYSDYELTVIAEKDNRAAVASALDGMKCDFPVYIPSGRHTLLVSFR
ncbi:MAG: hypothetical protein IJS94_08450 [Clostridia bacterium]|nr:hypothetical protein [Clostridia bacterium]